MNKRRKKEDIRDFAKRRCDEKLAPFWAQLNELKARADTNEKLAGIAKEAAAKSKEKRR